MENLKNSYNQVKAIVKSPILDELKEEVESFNFLDNLHWEDTIWQRRRPDKEEAGEEEVWETLDLTPKHRKLLALYALEERVERSLGSFAYPGEELPVKDQIKLSLSLRKIRDEIDEIYGF